MALDSAAGIEDYSVSEDQWALWRLSQKSVRGRPSLAEFPTKSFFRNESLPRPLHSSGMIPWHAQEVSYIILPNRLIGFGLGAMTCFGSRAGVMESSQTKYAFHVS